MARPSTEKEISMAVHNLRQTVKPFI